MIKINLLEYRRLKKVMQIQKELGKHLLLIILSIAVIGFFWTRQKDRIDEVNVDIVFWKNELQKINQTVKKVDEAKAKKERLGLILENIKILNENKEEPAKIMDKINIRLPSEVWLSKFEGTDSVIKLEGYSFSDPSIANFMKNLEKISNYFTGVELIESRQVEILGRKIKKFTIQCNRKPKKSLSKAKTT